MTTRLAQAVEALNQDYLRRYPREAAQVLGRVSRAEAVRLLAALSVPEALPVWQGLPLDAAENLLPDLPPPLRKHLLTSADPVWTSRLLARLDAEMRQSCLAQLNATKVAELNYLGQFPANSAGALMDVRHLPLKSDMQVGEALHQVRKYKPRFSQYLFIVDDEGRLHDKVEIQELAVADPRQAVSTLAKPVRAAVLSTATREDVTEQFERHKLTDLPVVDVNGILLGVIRYDTLVTALREVTSADLLTMVGASKDERALSRVSFVVRKRLPWLQINLLTAFLAAAVVGLFESTIAQFTALAVLLPVVAGQSGNTGAQALAVTMRGLALREIGTSHWRRVARKELGAGMLNGVAVALTTALGVWVWSGSAGLAAVIALSMVIAMSAAGVAGVMVPMVLSALGQDPAQSSSIILTTITDVTGFFSFLGIATVLAGFL